MSKKVLSIVETAYRATLEEQDDTIIWLTHAMKGAGADIDILLRGNAVNYAVKGQDASGLAFGEKRQTQPPRLDEDVAKLVGKGTRVYLVREDLAERGISAEELIGGVEMVSRKELPKLFAGYDQVWHW
ncbi:MAG TPA: DsrE family protein [Blastocatellia bacterium]|nr:DsrE family protein [Blastocatellia bacterium]